MGIGQEKCFPRGAIAPKKPKDNTEVKDKKISKKEKELFSINDLSSKVVKNKHKKKQKKSKGNIEDDQGCLSVKAIDPLTYDKLTEGLRVLARISEVRDLELKLSLPGRLVAVVPITKISNPYTEALKIITENPNKIESLGVKQLNEMFQEGQLVTCAIEKVEKTKEDFYKVTASINPNHVNDGLLNNIKKGDIIMGAIKSIEDHGFVMDIGKNLWKGFLPTKKAVDSNKLSIGQVVPCVATKIDGNVVILSSKTNTAPSIKNFDDIRIHSMSPGMSFETKVETNLKNGLKLKFGDFEGYVHVSHQGQEELEVGQQTKATVLYVLATLNHIYLSLQEDLQFNVKNLVKINEKSTKIGELVKNCDVIEADHRGLVIRLNDQNGVGLVPVRHLNENLKKDFKSLLNSQVNARVIQYDHFDGVFVCSMQKSLLEQNIVKIEQLSPGELLTVKAKKFNDKGLVVEVGRNLDGFIPHVHLSDVPLKHPEKKFNIGDKLKVKVLKVDPSKRRLHLTHKRLLVENINYTMVDDYDEKFVNQITEGVVCQVTNEGVLLQLFNDVCGWVPKSKISVETIEHPEKLFFLGQVLKSKVLDVTPHKKRMSLTLILTEEKLAPLGSKQKKISEKIQKGVVYENIKVCDKTAEGLGIEVNGVKGLIPKNHLTDHIFIVDRLMSSYNVNDIIEKALCFESDVIPILTLKESIMNFEDVQGNFDDLHEGQIIPTVVSNIKPYGIFVKSPIWKVRKSFLIPLRHLSDVFVENPNDYVELNQTIYGKILEKNEKEQKITMTSKTKEITSGLETFDHILNLTTSLFGDFDKLKQSQILIAHEVGDVVNTTIEEITQFGIESKLEDNTRAIIPKSTLHDLEEPVKGQTVAGVILYIDQDFGAVEMTLQPEIIKRSISRSKKLPPIGQNVKATCVLKRTEHFMASFCVKSPHQYQGQYVQVPMRRHINDLVGFGDVLHLYENYNITIVKSSSNDGGNIIGVYDIDKLSRKKGFQKRTRETSLTLLENCLPSPEAKKSKTTSSSNTENVIGNKIEKIETEEVEEEEEKEEDVEKAHQNKTDPGWEKDFNPWGCSVEMTPKENQTNDELELDDGNNEEGKSSKKGKTHLSKKEKKELAKLEELAIKEAEKRVIEGQDVAPESIDEFEKLVLSSPDSSLCWIQYMAFHIERKEYDLAREVVRKSLSKINFREENERFNVYMAWFNLEHHYGASEEDADKVFKEAVQCNDEFKVYNKVASIYMENGKIDKAEKMYKLMARKFNKELEVWLALGQFYFKVYADQSQTEDVRKKSLDNARFTLQRSVQNLKKSELVQISSKFAQFEFQFGEAERGKTIFETIVRDFPSRIDQWCVYVDMVIKKGELETTREIFERMIHLGLAPKKMKSLFKKYWEFEQKHGDQSQADVVRKKALEYLEKQNISVSENDDPMDQMEIC